MQTTKNFGKRWLIAGISFIILLMAIYFGQRWMSATIENKIRTAISGEEISFDEVNAHFMSSELDITGFNTKIHADKKNAANYHSIYFKRIKVSGIQFLKILFKKELIIQRIVFDSTRISINEKLFSDTSATYQHLRNNRFEKIDVSNINLTNGIISKGFYKYQLSDVTIHKDLKLINAGINSVKIIPVYSKEEFNRKRKFQSDRIVATVKGLRITNLDYESLLFKGLKAESISIQNASVFVFRDRRLPRQEEVQPLPAAMLKKIPFPIRLKSFKILNSSVDYEEYPRDGNHSGKLKVEHLKLSLSPVINHPVKNDPAQMSMKASGSLMGSGTVNITMTLPLRSGEYDVHGSIQNLDLTKLNSPAENLGNIHIKSGLLDSLGFRFSFNEKKSSGKIVGIYHQLVIQPIGKNKKIQKFKSFILRNLIIPINKDRSLAESKRTGKIDYTRDPSRKVSFYLLQSLLTGIKSSFKLGFLLPK